LSRPFFSRSRDRRCPTQEARELCVTTKPRRGSFRPPSRVLAMPTGCRTLRANPLRSRRPRTAELSIQEAVKLSLSDALAKSDTRTTALKTLMTVVNDLWEKENLPSDIRRLAENIMTLAKLVDLDAAALRLLLEEEKVGGRGPLIANLSPYGAVLQTLIDRKQVALNSALTKRQKRSVLIPAEIAMPAGINTTAWQQSAIFVKASDAHLHVNPRTRSSPGPVHFSFRLSRSVPQAHRRSTGSCLGVKDNQESHFGFSQRNC
jgi:hypothetical protein